MVEYKALEKALDKAWLKANKHNDEEMLLAIESFNNRVFDPIED